MFVIEQHVPPAPPANSVAQVLAELNAVYDVYNEVACLMLGSQDLSVGLILNGLTSDFAGSVRNYNMHNIGKMIDELHVMLIEFEKGLPKKAATPQRHVYLVTPSPAAENIILKDVGVVPRKEKDPKSFTLPCYINNVCFDNALAGLEASVSVMPLSTYLNLGLGELAHTKLTVELADRTVKYPKGIAENVLVEARIIGETLVLNRSLDPLYGDYIELNDLNVPLELRRDQVDDLIPTIEECEVIDEPMIDIIKTRNNESFDEYHSFCDFDWKIHIECAYNLRFSCMIVVENMDGYRDQKIGDVILREPFCKASCVEARSLMG
nr:hypothetical protein [Tanacetum cinerariifolium]